MDTLLFSRPRATLFRSVLTLHLLAGTAYFSPSATASHLECAAQHLAKAEQFRRGAAAFRQDAAHYREDLLKEKRAIAMLPKSGENPWWRKARLHYEPLIEDAERRASEADRQAEHHRFRATELETSRAAL